ncbi:MAG: flagellar motor protein MotB [Bryobacteraceae bacterium]
MKRRSGYLVGETGGRDRWMVSYTDVMTILLILFVAVAAKAVQTPPKPAGSTEASGDALQNAKTVLESRGIRPSLEARGLVISLPQAILYPSGEDQVSPEALPLIGEIAAVLRNLPNKVTLVGHADPVPIHNGRFRNNWELSAARSLRLLELLTSRYEIAESRLAVSSLGSYSPRSSNSTAEGRAENRCVEIVILNETPAS